MFYSPVLSLTTIIIDSQKPSVVEFLKGFFSTSSPNPISPQPALPPQIYMDFSSLGWSPNANPGCGIVGGKGTPNANYKINPCPNKRWGTMGQRCFLLQIFYSKVKYLFIFCFSFRFGGWWMV